MYYISSICEDLIQDDFPTVKIAKFVYWLLLLLCNYSCLTSKSSSSGFMDVGKFFLHFKKCIKQKTDVYMQMSWISMFLPEKEKK